MNIPQAWISEYSMQILQMAPINNGHIDHCVFNTADS